MLVLLSNGHRLGYIDSKGALVVPMKYCPSSIGQFWTDRAAVRDPVSFHFGYIDLEGTPVIPTKYKEAKEFRDGRAWVKGDNDRWGLIDKNGKLIVDCIYPDVGQFFLEQGRWLCSVVHSDGTSFFDPRRGLIDDSGALVLPFEYRGFAFSEGLSGATLGSLLGYIDIRGNVVIQPQFKSAGDFSEGLASVTYGHRYRRMDPDGPRLQVPGIPQSMIDPDVPRPRVIDRTGATVFEHDFLSVGKFSQGLAVAESTRNGLFGFIDKSGAVVIEPRFKAVHWDGFYPCGVAIVQEKQHYVLIDKSGKRVGKNRFSDVFLGYSFDHTLFCVRERRKWGFVNFRGDYESKPRFESKAVFINGLAQVRSRRTIVGRNGHSLLRSDFIVPFTMELVPVDV